MDASSGGLGVSTDSDGQVNIWESETGDVRVGFPVFFYMYPELYNLHFD